VPRPWSRKRPDPSPVASTDRDEADTVALGGDDHAWWAQRDVTGVVQPKRRRSAEQQAEAEQRDILAEHFGEDWRTSFGFTLPTDEELAEAKQREAALDESDPYRVLGVEPTASWDDIVTAHRDLVRVHHPDRLFGQSEEEKAEGDDRIIAINAAFQELRVRRDR
jgi:DnaJ-class molecular chaperone